MIQHKRRPGSLRIEKIMNRSGSATKKPTETRLDDKFERLIRREIERQSALNRS